MYLWKHIVVVSFPLAPQKVYKIPKIDQWMKNVKKKNLKFIHITWNGKLNRFISPRCRDAQFNNISFGSSEVVQLGDSKHLDGALPGLYLWPQCGWEEKLSNSCPLKTAQNKVELSKMVRALSMAY